MASLGLPFEPIGHPVEFLSLTGQRGAQVRATVHSFGPLLLGKVLDLNDTQTSILSLDLQVLRRQRSAAARPEGPRRDAQVPRVGRGQADPRPSTAACRAPRSACFCARSSCSSRRAPTSSSASPSSTSSICCARRPTAQGVVSLLELADVMDKPRLFSTFMLWILAQLYETLPEAGDLPKPKLCFFFDEAHLFFDDASEALMDEIERTARLIRSKGVGVYFVTQAPDRRALVGAVAAGQSRPARVARVHAGGRRQPAQDCAHVPDDRVLQRREDAHVARHRRGGDHGPVAARHPHAAWPRRGWSRPIRRWRRSARSASRQQLAGSAAADEVRRDRRSRQCATSGSTRGLTAARRPLRRRPCAARWPPTTQAGMNTMTPAQQRREIARQAREIAAARRAAERERKAQAARHAKRVARASSSASHRQRDPHRRPRRHARAWARTSCAAFSARILGGGGRRSYGRRGSADDEVGRQVGRGRVGRLQLVDRLGEDARHGQVAQPVAVGRDDIPGRVVGRRLR